MQTKSATPTPLGALETVAELNGPIVTGVTVSHEGRIFVTHPRWGDDVTFTVGEVRNGSDAAYPDEATNRYDPGNPAAALVSVQSVVVDPANRLWLVDTGSPMFALTRHGGPKLVCVDLATNKVTKTILFPEDVALWTTYLNDVRFDLRRGSEGMAYITDSAEHGPNGIIVVDLGTGESWRRLNDHPSTKAVKPPDFVPVVEGKPLMERFPAGLEKPVAMGSDGIAISADGSRLYYCPLASSHLYSVSTDALIDRSQSDDAVAATVVDEGDKGGGSDGLESDAAGSIYATSYEHNSVIRRGPGGGAWETVVQDSRLIWPDTMSIATDGYLYVSASQLNRQKRYHAGKDLR